MFGPKNDVSLRYFVSYRKFNAMTVQDSYTLQGRDECIDLLGKAAISSTLDVSSGYWKIEICQEDRETRPAKLIIRSTGLRVCLLS